MDNSTQIRVLVVDDDSTYLNTVKNGLFQFREPHYVISMCATPSELMEKIEQFKPDVVLLDNDFHKTKIGISRLLPEIVGRFPYLQDGIIICTGGRDLSDSSELKEAFHWNAAKFLDKPISMVTLTKAINDIYENKYHE
jgi:response regulator of citrate/malate metabolism